MATLYRLEDGHLHRSRKLYTKGDPDCPECRGPGVVPDKEAPGCLTDCTCVSAHQVKLVTSGAKIITKFAVLFEAPAQKAQVNIFAASHEEAVAKVASRKVERTARLHAAWVDTAANAEIEGFEHEILGRCVDCGNYVVNRTIEGQPWTYASDPDNEHSGDPICYPCASARGIRNTED